MKVITRITRETFRENIHLTDWTTNFHNLETRTFSFSIDTVLSSYKAFIDKSPRKILSRMLFFTRPQIIGIFIGMFFFRTGNIYLNFQPYLGVENYLGILLFIWIIFLSIN